MSSSRAACNTIGCGEVDAWDWAKEKDEPIKTEHRLKRKIDRMSEQSFFIMATCGVLRGGTVWVFDDSRKGSSSQVALCYHSAGCLTHDLMLKFKDDPLSNIDCFS
jgi:hypothetical protein